MKKGWFSIGKLKDKKNKTPKQDKAKDADKEKKDALYDNFLKETKQKKKSVENEYDASKAAQAPANDENKTGNANKQQNNKKPKLKDNQQQQKKTIEQMIDELDSEEFGELITNIKSKFPNSNTAWLSEAAFYLNNNVPSNVKDVLNVFNGALDYPSSLLKESFKKKLIDLFNLFTKEELYQVQLSIIESIIPNIYLTGLSGPVGYLLFLQNLSLYLGSNSSESVERLASAEIRNKYKEKPNVYLTQVWCLQSVGVLSLSEGLNVWKKLYSPMLDHKYFYQFGIKYLQHVLSNNNNSNCRDAGDIVGVKDLIRISKLKASPEHQEILEKVLPKLKLIVLSNQTDANIVNCFSELISNLNSFKNENQLEEFVIGCLVFCLERNRQCFDIWYEYHAKISDRDPLLEHLLANPNAVQSQRKAFRSTLQKIGKFNDKQGQASYQSKDILKTMSNTKSCRSNFVLLLLIALLTYVIYDTRLNGSFERSDTARYLKKWKVYNYVQPVAINIERNVISLKRQFDVKYGPTVNSYVDQIVRQYDSNVRPTIDPYLGQVVNVSTPYVISLKENSVLAYRYAEKYCVIYTRQAGVFLEKNVFTGPLEISNLKLVFNDVYEKAVNAYIDAYRWASNKLASLVQQ